MCMYVYLPLVILYALSVLPLLWPSALRQILCGFSIQNPESKCWCSIVSPSFKEQLPGPCPARKGGGQSWGPSRGAPAQSCAVIARPGHEAGCQLPLVFLFFLKGVA